MAIIGIDLGTTNSACGVWENGDFTLIPNRLGEKLTPSVVGIDNYNNLLIGKTAGERLRHFPDKTVATFKRLMGSNHQVELGKQKYTPTELSALILAALKEDAETYLGHEVNEAVISVPAYFNDNQRFSTKQAAELVGLKVERLINEPTAAALAYGLNEEESGTFLILDLGGGTFDVSIIEFFDGIMEVHASSGDNFLGGEDFTETMLKNLLYQHNLDENQLTLEEKSLLFSQMEQVKKKINQTHTLSFKAAGQTFENEINEDWFNKIVAPLLLRLKRPIQRALNDAKLAMTDIDEVVLVGGATRMQAFRSLIAKLLGRLPVCHLDPDLVVAMGATIQAGLKAKDAQLDDVVLTDVCPYTLGTAILNRNTPQDGNYFSPIIERNTTVPTSIVKKFVTSRDDQTDITIEVYQGENRFVKQNVFLGKLSIKVPSAPAGQEEIDLRYSYDMNGLLEVDVKVCSTGEISNIVIEQVPGAMSDEQVEQARKRLSVLKIHPRDMEKNRLLLVKGEQLYQSSLGNRRDYIGNLLSKFEQALNAQDKIKILKLHNELQGIFEELEHEELF